MGTMLQLPAFPRHGILLNPSPTTSPYGHPASLPSTPHLISSYSSLSSSASSNSPHRICEADHYFLTCSASPRDSSAIPRNGSLTPTTLSGVSSTASTIASREFAKRASITQARKIRFAPLPEPRRDELPEVFVNDSMENLSSLPLASVPEAPRASTSAPPRPNSLLFSGTTEHQVNSTGAIVAAPPATSSNGWSHISTSSSSTPIAIAPSSQSQTSGTSSDRYDSDTDLATPQSPAMNLLSSSSSFIERYPCAQSCPDSPIGRRPDLPTGVKDRRWSTKKLFKPFLKKDISITPEDVLTLGVNQLFRSSTRDRDRDDDGASSSGAATPLRSQSKERSEVVSGSENDFGMPLARCTSDQTAGGKKKRKSSFLSSLTGSSSQQQQRDDGLWRTQSATDDLRRSKSRESHLAALEDVKRPRSSSTNFGPNGQPRARKQLKMLNGRVYGAKRNNLNGVNLFASARSEEPEFVEWGYGGMGSVKSSATVGNNKYSRVQGSAAIGSSSDNAGWSTRRASTGGQNNDDDDGTGMAWLKKRREQREREKKEAQEKESQESEEVADVVVADAPVSPVKEETEAEQRQQEAPAVAPSADEPEHVTQAVTLPAPSHLPSHSHSYSHAYAHGRPSIERVPSHAVRLSMERKGSADTARQEHFTAVADVYTPTAEVEAVGDMDIEGEQILSPPADATPRERRESESSGNSDSASGSSSDEDADAEDDDEDFDAEEEERIRRTAVGAGVEKISRHK